MTVHGSCHCKATTFELRQAPTTITRCNCTFCSKRGILWAYYQPVEVTITSRRHDAVYASSRYPFTHHHCSVCGCGTYTESPESVEEPDFSRMMIGINARLLDDIDIDSLPVELLDGPNLL